MSLFKVKSRPLIEPASTDIPEQWVERSQLIPDPRPRKIVELL